MLSIPRQDNFLQNRVWKPVLRQIFGLFLIKALARVTAPAPVSWRGFGVPAGSFGRLNPVQPQPQAFAVAVFNHQEFFLAAGLKVERAQDLVMGVAVFIAPAQMQAAPLHDGQFVLAVQAAVDGPVVSHFRVSR